MKLSNDCYQELDAKERWRLALAARTRNDLREYRRLQDTCPYCQVVKEDPEFTWLMGRSRDIGAVFTIYWLRIALWKAELCWCLAEIEQIESSDNQLRKRAADRLDSVISKEKGLHEGLEKFCQAIGIQANALLCIYPDVAEGYAETTSRIPPEVIADPTAVNTVYDQFMEIWKGLP
ncbi:MAG: hypothetical protein V1495_05400 [Pseudomonadota bacterium]